MTSLLGTEENDSKLAEKKDSDNQCGDNEVLTRMIDDMKHNGHIDSNQRMGLIENASKIIRISKSQITTDNVATSVASKFNIQLLDALDLIIRLREAIGVEMNVSKNESTIAEVILSISGPKKYMMEDVRVVYYVNNHESIIQGIRKLGRFKSCDFFWAKERKKMTCLNNNDEFVQHRNNIQAQYSQAKSDAAFRYFGSYQYYLRKEWDRRHKDQKCNNSCQTGH